MPRPTLLAVSHGTADAAGAASIADLIAQVADALPDVEVHAAFVDVQQPDAADVLVTLPDPVVVVPLLLSRGFHVHQDLHGMVANRPDAVVADALGPDPRLADLLVARLAHATAPAPNTPIVLAVAGSRDPLSLTDAEVMAALLRERVDHPVALAYLAARQPDLPTAVAAHPDAVVATYLLARGYFFDLAQRQAGRVPISAPLLDGGVVPHSLVELVIARYEAAALRVDQR